MPLYLIQVKPLLQLDGVMLAENPALMMGQSQYWQITLNEPAGKKNYTKLFTVAAGDEIVFGFNGNGIEKAAVDKRLSGFPEMSAAENLHQIAMHYWMEYDLVDAMTAKFHGLVKQRLPSIGLFASPLSITYFWDVPMSGYYQARTMDVNRSYMAVAGKTQVARKNFMMQSGIQGSYLEGAIFDQLFSRGQGIGVSTAQLLIEAVQNQIPVYHVDSNNITAVLPLLQIDAAVRQSIVDSVSAGKTAVVPERPPNGGVMGYIIQDPVTGGGAYLISGGLSGGMQFVCEPAPVPLLEALRTLALILALIAAIGLIVSGGGAVVGGAVLARLIASMGAAGMLFSGGAYASEPLGCCAIAFKEYPTCEVFEQIDTEIYSGFYIFTSKQQAEADVRLQLGDPSITLKTPKPAERGPCSEDPGRGEHWTARRGGTNEYLGSVGMCKCCTDIGNNKAILEERWSVLLP